jgi:hypothetical protein
MMIRRPAVLLMLLVAVVSAGCERQQAPTRVTPMPFSLHGWAADREVTNPVVAIAQNPEETVSQYVPAPILLPNGEVWIYVKGDLTQNISAYRSTDGGVSFEFQGVAVPRGPEGSWDSGSVIDPVAVFDSTTNTVHLWYKGGERPNVGSPFSWGYATASADRPSAFVKHAGNPILTPADIESALGEEGVWDNYPRDVVRIGGNLLFYGGFASDEGYKIFLATASDWSSPVPNRVLMVPEPGTDLVQCPFVFRNPADSSYLMSYSVGFDADRDPGLGRHLRVAQSSDGVNWTPLPGALLQPDTRFEWEEKRVYCSSVLRTPGVASAEPALRNGKLQMYYSGSSFDHEDQVGLLYLSPPAAPR